MPPNEATTSNRASAPLLQRLLRLVSEPVFHFFVIGLLLFVIHEQLVGDPRTIVIDPAIQSDLARRFRDEYGRPPNQSELERLLNDWKREEALYQEAVLEGLVEQDPTVRQVLVERLRARLLLELPRRDPTRAELEAWRDSHKELYEVPLRYHYEYARFEKSEASAEEELSRFEKAVTSGKDPASLGRVVFGGKLTVTELKEKLGPVAAERIPSLPVGSWHRLEVDDGIWLLRVKEVLGGMPSFEELQPRLVADWRADAEKVALDRAIQGIVERYRFKEER